MTHEKEIKYWAEHADNTKVWSKSINTENANWWLDENPIWNSKGHIYIVDNEWAELRKANADGYIIQQKGKINHTMPDNWWNVGFYDTAFSIFKPEDFHIKSKEWYVNIPKEGVVCWVWDYHEEEKRLGIVIDFCRGAGYPFKGIANGFCNGSITYWMHAKPVKPEECWQGE